MFEQIGMAAPHLRGHQLGDAAVIDGISQVVRPAGLGQVSLDINIDLEGLGPLSFLRQDAMGPHSPEAPQLDVIHPIPG